LDFEHRPKAFHYKLIEGVIKSSEIKEVLDKDQVRSLIARRLGMNIGGKYMVQIKSCNSGLSALCIIG
jgi:hypothetical protein